MVEKLKTKFVCESCNIAFQAKAKLEVFPCDVKMGDVYMGVYASAKCPVCAQTITKEFEALIG